MEESSKNWGDVIDEMFQNKIEIKKNVVNPNLDELEDHFTENQKYIMDLVRELDNIYNQLIHCNFNNESEANFMIESYYDVKKKLRDNLPSLPKE